MFKFTLTLATSTFLFMSGTADLLAMEPLEDESKAVAINHITQLILEKASKDINPRHLVRVCKNWYCMIRESKDPQWHELNELRYSTMNPFMKKCMNTYWEGRFYNGVLKHTPGILEGAPRSSRQPVLLKFSDLNKDGTFDLSIFRDQYDHLVITTNMDRFFKVREENEHKVMVLITPRYLVEQRITTSPTHPIAALMADGDPDTAPINIFWRDGDDENLAMVDCLTTLSAREISSCQLYDNYYKVNVRAESSGLRRGGILHSFTQLLFFSCQFFEPK